MGAYRQSNYSSALGGSGAGPRTISFSSLQQAGSCNVVLVAWGDTTNDITAITDSHSQTYTLVGGAPDSYSTGTMRQRVYICANIAPDPVTPNQISVTWGGTPTTPSIAIAEYNLTASASPSDTTNASISDGHSSAPTATTATTTNANDLVVGCVSSKTSQTFTQGGSSTLRTTSPGFAFIEDVNVAATGAQTASGTLGGTAYWIARTITLKSGTTVRPGFVASSGSSASITVRLLARPGIVASSTGVAVTHGILYSAGWLATSSATIQPTTFLTRPRLVANSTGSSTLVLRYYARPGLVAGANSSANITVRLYTRPGLVAASGSSGTTIGTHRLATPGLVAAAAGSSTIAQPTKLTRPGLLASSTSSGLIKAETGTCRPGLIAHSNSSALITYEIFQVIRPGLVASSTSGSTIAPHWLARPGLSASSLSSGTIHVQTISSGGLRPGLVANSASGAEIHGSLIWSSWKAISSATITPETTTVRPRLVASSQSSSTITAREIIIRIPIAPASGSSSIIIPRLIGGNNLHPKLIASSTSGGRFGGQLKGTWKSTSSASITPTLGSPIFRPHLVAASQSSANAQFQSGSGWFYPGLQASSASSASITLRLYAAVNAPISPASYSSASFGITLKGYLPYGIKSNSFALITVRTPIRPRFGSSSTSLSTATFRRLANPRIVVSSSSIASIRFRLRTGLVASANSGASITVHAPNTLEPGLVASSSSLAIFTIDIRPVLIAASVSNATFNLRLLTGLSNTIFPTPPASISVSSASVNVRRFVRPGLVASSNSSATIKSRIPGRPGLVASSSSIASISLVLRAPLAIKSVSSAIISPKIIGYVARPGLIASSTSIASITIREPARPRLVASSISSVSIAPRYRIALNSISQSSTGIAPHLATAQKCNATSQSLMQVTLRLMARPGIVANSQSSAIINVGNQVTPGLRSNSQSSASIFLRLRGPIYPASLSSASISWQSVTRPTAPALSNSFAEITIEPILRPHLIARSSSEVVFAGRTSKDYPINASSSSASDITPRLVKELSNAFYPNSQSFASITFHCINDRRPRPHMRIKVREHKRVIGHERD